jgi:hypothetical protein
MQLDDDAIVRILDNMPHDEPPADLRKQIMRSVSGAAAFRPPTVYRFGGLKPAAPLMLWAAAAAIVIGFFLISTVRHRENTAATMAPAAVSVTRAAEVITIEIATPGSISVWWDPNSADFVGVSGAASASSGKDQTTFTISGPSGRAAVALRARPSASSVVVSVSVDGHERWKQSVPLK